MFAARPLARSSMTEAIAVYSSFYWLILWGFEKLSLLMWVFLLLLFLVCIYPSYILRTVNSMPKKTLAFARTSNTIH